MRVVAFLALCLAAVAAVPADLQRIVGGSTTTIQKYPTIAACLYSWNSVTYFQACGGTILNNRSILTAAHCTVGRASNKWRVRLGSTWANSGGVVYNTQTIINHPQYNSKTFDNDVAVIRINRDIQFNNNVRPASIATTNYKLGDNEIVWAAGWGLTSENGRPSEQLRHVQIWTINQNVCRQRYGASTITDNMLCSGWLDVGGRDQCQQDSGGPLYHNGILVGVCSFGNGCARPRYPGVNARVSALSPWITANA